ncbi:glycosyltransferase [Parafrankia discariae]|uniref:glycosyltransferase n=1 Tax=Parafrankia discariae TaxID=365528 RepID=UPI0003A51D7E|nr:glycosyltransferase family 2 protein [Parafrankia discariae]
MTGKPVVTGKTVAVIVHYGGVDPTVSLAARLDTSPAVDQVVAVANDLTGRPAELPASVAWIVPPRNLGFGGGFRCGTDAYPSASTYILLNNDVRLDEATIAECLRALAGDDVGIVAPTLVNADGLQSGAAVTTRVLGAPRVLRVPPTGDVHDADWVTGAVMFVKARCHRQVPMDCRFFLGWEDLEFCRRARRAGWRVLLSPARAWHTGGATLPAKAYGYYYTRNQLWFARMSGWRVRAALIALWSGLVVLPRTVALDLLRRRGTALSVLVFHGLLDGLTRLPSDDAPLPDEPRAARWSRWG